MKTSIYLLCMTLCFTSNASSQTSGTTDQVIEGSKVIVELVKALSGKKDPEKDTGCKGKYADLCIVNESGYSIAITLEHRLSAERREVVILPKGKECSLQARVGVWTYDLKLSGGIQSIRKGDLMIEGCNNMVMQISY